LALLFCLFALSNAAPTPDVSSPESGEQSPSGNDTIQVQVDKLVEAAAPRQFGRSGSSSAQNCVNNCEQPWKRQRDQAKVGGVTNYNITCAAHDKIVPCLNACGASDSKTNMQKRIEQDQFMCHGSTYARNINCLRAAQAQVSPTCDAATKCGKHYQGNDGSLKGTMKVFCTSTACELACRGPTILSKCGQAALNDEKGVIKKGTEYLKWRVVDSPNGQPSQWPASDCDPLLRVI